jgi:hypothetical protein
MGDRPFDGESAAAYLGAVESEPRVTRATPGLARAVRGKSRGLISAQKHDAAMTSRRNSSLTRLCGRAPSPLPHSGQRQNASTATAESARGMALLAANECRATATKSLLCAIYDFAGPGL